MKAIKNHQGAKSRFGEFPDLLFTACNNNRIYFDMTHFLRMMKLDSEGKISEFTEGFALWIGHLGKVYGIPPEEMFFSDSSRHRWAEESLALPFLSCIDPVFGGYLLESMTQMLIEGVVCSDTYILMQARSRFTNEELVENPKTL